MDIFNEGKELLRGVFYADVRRFDSFCFLKSVFPEKWYNLIEPTVPPANLDWYMVYATLDAQTREGVAVSYYVPHYLHPSYKPILGRKGYIPSLSDSYVRKTLCRGEHLPAAVFRDIDAAAANEYKALVSLCFPNFTNSDEYCRICLAQTAANSPEGDKVMRNIALYDNEKLTAFGSLLYSRSLRLGYIHNVGTHPEHRRKGCFSRIVQFMCHEAAQDGVEAIYANCQTDGASYHGFLKNGFQENIRYHLYTI